MAALSYDRRIHVWDLVSQTLIGESINGTSASWLAIDPSEDYEAYSEVQCRRRITAGHSPTAQEFQIILYVFVGDSANGIGRFSLSAEALTARARQIAGRELTAAERSLYIDEPSA